MSRATSLIAVLFTAVVGIILGVMLANWRFGGSHFTDAEVLLAARILAGGLGMFLFGYLASTFITKKRYAVE